MTGQELIDWIKENKAENYVIYVEFFSSIETYYDCSSWVEVNKNEKGNLIEIKART